MEPHACAPASSPADHLPKVRESFPLTVKSGSTSVTIYRTPTRIRGRLYDRFTLAYSIGGTRRRQTFPDLRTAKEEASKIVSQKERGELGVATLSAADRLRLEDALHALAGVPHLGTPSVARLAEIVTEYAGAVSLLPTGSRLDEAVRYFAARHPSNMPRRTVAAVVEELIQDRTAAGCSNAHLRDLADRLGKFAAAFQVAVGELDAPMVREYLRNLRSVSGRPLTNRSRRNVQRAITTLVRFARKMKYLPRELADELTDIEPPKVEETEVGVFTPAQLRVILHAAPDDVRAALAIGAFAGLRTAELQRLDWSAVKLGERVIILDAGLTKTASRRVVPILDNLAAWLTPLVKASGKVSPAPNDRALNHRFARIAARNGIDWVRNGLRHSFCSYRLAVTHDPARVATEAGNSPSMVHKHYKALVTEAQGTEWFAIVPGDAKASVIPFRIPDARESIAAPAASTRTS